jgi:hypothetical protein
MRLVDGLVRQLRGTQGHTARAEHERDSARAGSLAASADLDQTLGELEQCRAELETERAAHKETQELLGLAKEALGMALQSHARAELQRKQAARA